MAKIHIALVGGQTAPVYLGIVDANPDKVTLGFSEQTVDEQTVFIRKCRLQIENVTLSQFIDFI
ncbi:MAG: hypothetical protein Q7U47_11235 [Paludibacter sp.]|nr:hypothetical protein [Paludibacter sp.]